MSVVLTENGTGRPATAFIRALSCWKNARPERRWNASNSGVVGSVRLAALYAAASWIWCRSRRTE